MSEGVPHNYTGKTEEEIQRLELDIDTRLTNLWREAAEVEEWNLEVVAAFMRAAYGAGYVAALTEVEPGQLATDHGYRVPSRQQKALPGIIKIIKRLF